MLYTLRQLLQAHFGSNSFICSPILSKQGLMVIGAEPKAGKSIVATNIAYDLAAKNTVLGQFHPSKECRVLYFDQEVGGVGMKDRLSKIEITKQGLNVGLNVQDYLHVVTKDLKLRIDDVVGRAAIEHYIQEAKPDVVVFDPLVCFHSKDENDNSQMHQVMEEFAKMQQKHNFASILVHHFGKPPDPRTGRPTADPNRSRGASTIYGDAETFISLSAQYDVANQQQVVTIDYSLRHSKKPEQHKMRYGTDLVLR